MKISTKGRYGLTIMIDLAMHLTGGPVSLKSVAKRQSLSEPYLEQLIAPLRNAGLVRSVRGANGGYVLEHPPKSITAADIILTLEGPLQLVGEDVDDGLRPLWERLQTSMLSVLEAVSLEELVAMKQQGEGDFMYYI